jgi:hypothetical protein
MKLGWVLSIFITLLWVSGITSPVDAKGGGLPPQLLVHAGKAYRGVEDPEYISYDLALRDYLVRRISERFGVALDPKTYSGFDLLEIESLFKCKKSNEPFDIFLKMFPKRP